MRKESRTNQTKTESTDTRIGGNFEDEKITREERYFIKSRNLKKALDQEKEFSSKKDERIVAQQDLIKLQRDRISNLETSKSSKELKKWRSKASGFEKLYLDIQDEFANWKKHFDKVINKQSNDDSSDLNRVLEWLQQENREPAQTKFTAGMLRNVAREIEFLLKR